MTLLDIVIIGAILGLGAMLQSAVGFGMALIVLPLLVLKGHPLPVAVALLLGAAIVQTAHGTYVTREHIRWRYAFSFAAIQWVALVGGVACMHLVVALDPAIIKQAVGAVVVVFVTVQLAFHPTPREKLGSGWMFAAGSTAGFLAGATGLGGPPLVFFALAHRWSRDRFRAFLWSQFLLVLPVLAAALVIRFGPHLLAWLGLGVAMAPIVWAGSRLGLFLTQHWERKRLQVAAVIMLYAIGITGLLGPYLK